MISIINKPITKITGDTSNTSKWVGVHQPVEFEVKRKDISIISIQNLSNGNKFFKINRNDFNNSGLKVGKPFSYLCGPENNKRQFTLTPLNFIIGDTIVLINVSMAGIIDVNKITNYEAYIIVDKKGYFIETFVYQSINNASLSLAGVVRSKTDVWGNAKVNIQKVLSSNVTNENNASYNKINHPVYNQGGIYNIKIREVYDGFIGAFTTLLNTDNLYFVNGSKQLQDPNNFNFGEFVPTLNDSRVSKAKFLSVFDKPTFFNNYPFDVSFIYSDNLLNKQIARVETINGTSTNTNLLANGRGFVNRLKLAGGYASSVKTVSLHLDASNSATTQNPSTGNGTLSTVGTVFNPYAETIKHSISDLNEWKAVFNGALVPNYNKYE
jgi:hypothetical protein